ncbi:hypothetical protein GCM10011519_34390 [Marmoricola endophyticus]|uniref:Integral membrane protein n=1 Tax=Marmoricola endophyticus TaxID=2040280 RepID=A0A917BVU6_9ACTN|nr:hypothetical protein [Marmoricola endophyticus]GGF57574.1 hypothetical protein GCM10011519_34390 [Marmoricola endophyticus]
MSTRTTGTGFGRVLVFVYGIFAVAATARSLVQLTTQYDRAPVAYWLSLLSGVVYCLATWAIAKDRRQVALAAVLVELVGVLAVGTWSVLDDGRVFTDATVWSDFGVGYGFIPVVLPFVGLWWLLRGSSHQSD